MGKIKLILAISLLLWSYCYALSSGQFAVAGVSDDQAAIDYFCRIKNYVSSDNKLKLADEILFPIEAYVKNRKVVFNKKKFLENYKIVINEKVKKAIANQKPEDLFATWQGISTEKGELWFSLVENPKTKEFEFKVIAINNK